jgi:hypothetical protein
VEVKAREREKRSRHMLDYWPSPLHSVDRAVVMVEQAIMAMITGVNDQGVEEIRCDCFELLCGSRAGFS